MASLRSAGSASSPRYAARETELTPRRGPGGQSCPARLANLAPGAGGYRSSIAASLLRASGFADVSDLIGGYQAWLAA